jgi:hypothetical protein
MDEPTPPEPHSPEPERERIYLTLVEERELRKSLAREVQRYIDNPGCNIPARTTALRRLRWALENYGQ